MENKKLKICYCLPKFDLSTDTHYFHLYDFINEVAKEVDMCLIIEKSFSDDTYFSGVKKIYVQKFSGKALRVLENLWLIIKARMSGYDNFYTHYSYVSGFNSGIVTRLTGGKSYYWNCGLAWKYKKDATLKLVLKTIHYLVTGANALVEGYVNNYNISKAKIKIMPNWIDLRRFENIDETVADKYNLPADKKIALFVHRLSERKGAHYIAKIAEKLKDQSDIVLVIAGDGPYMSKLQQEAKSLPNIKILGKVPNQDIPALMKKSDLFFMPSEEEGFPRVLLEAMASGLPYVAFDVGGVKEISSAQQFQFIIGKANSDGFSLSIQIILNNSKQRYILKEGNLEWVKRYDLNLIKNKFINLFK